ncbi:MAG TPA: hypothetical protein PLE12_10625 [Propionicimonas sp.]|nr:hypothetical protein [Propionicimonas sp.]
MAELMTMREIAGLAQVQRPVVSVWRRRARAGSHPFPTAHERSGNQELFRRDEVVAWLEDTRRGNNPDVRADAASHALLATGGRREAEALSALLTLHQLAGRTLAGLSAPALLDLAEEHDPDDRFLFGELERAGDLSTGDPPTVDLADLARTADDLVEAAWSPSAAHRRLLAARLQLPGSGTAQVALTEPARQFVLGLFGPLARELGRPAVMDATGCAVDVLAGVASALDLPVVVLDGDGPSHRLTVRQLLLAEVPYCPIDRDGGGWSVTGPTAHLVVLPAPERPADGPLPHLDLLDEIALQFDDRQLVLCLAPAATLSDPLAGEALTRRDQLLRDGYVRAIVRLPAGFRPAQAREHSAVWLLGPADQAPPADRRVLVGDLAGATIDGCAGLADDLLAAWQGADGARRRAWAHLHPVLVRDLVSASGSLVPPRTPRVAAPARGGAGWAVDLRATDTAGRLAGYRFEPLPHTAEEVTLAQAVERRWVRVVPGRRLVVDGLPAGNVVVLDADSVRSPGRSPVRSAIPSSVRPGARSGPDPTPEASGAATRLEPGGPDPRPAGERPARGVDRLALLARCDADLTEPGDIVFTVTPTPAAILDVDGGSLVLAPARVLRLRPDAPLAARAVVARINAATTAGWRAWRVAVLPEPDRTNLGEALTDLAAQRARLVAELAALDALTHDLTTAVESRQLRITKENHGPNLG